MIDVQLALEKNMLDRGVQRYHSARDTAEDNERGADTTYARQLLPGLCTELADLIEVAKTAKGAGRQHKALIFLRLVDSNQAAFLTMKLIFNCLMNNKNIVAIASELGTRIEDQVRFERFEAEHKQLYAAIIKDFKRKRTSAYRHQHRVLTHKANEKEDGWSAWTPQEKLLVGTKLIELAILSTGIIQKKIITIRNKSIAVLQPTEEALEWIEEHTAHAELLQPDFMPCVVPPSDWTSLEEGGYFSPALRTRCPFVKTKSKLHWNSIKRHSFTEPREAVNAIQKTAWSINIDVYKIMQEVWRRNLQIGMPGSEQIVPPPCPFPRDADIKELGEFEQAMFVTWKHQAARAYTEERQRVSKALTLKQVFTMANIYKEYDAFYFVYNCDFRGRIYAATSGLSPQGTDFGKGLLQFSKGKELGAEGAYWVAVHGSNVYGYDKDSYDGRVAFIREREDMIKAVAANPLGSAERSIWSNADKPYQFLAFCFEWAQYLEQGDSFVSRIAVALDGSCNGLQNFSAMLRDSIGGAATNLLPSEEPQDIYARVAEVCVHKLQHRLTSDEPEGIAMAERWLEVGINRKCAKRPVMTLPYGSTQQSCRDYIAEYLYDTDQVVFDRDEVFKAACYLSPILWESIGEVVIAARAAMDWLKKASRVMSKSNKVIQWKTPSGFLVYQGSMQSTAQKVKTQLCGRLMLTLRTCTDKVDTFKQANGISPNFVHSMDATHLVKTVIHGAASGVQDWAMIHDSFGTYAADTPALAKAIREAFVEMYTEQDVLAEWKKVQEDCIGESLPDLPKKGDLDLQKVLDAKYFFG